MTLVAQRRSSLSALLPLALLLVLCFVFLKCEAVPGTVEMDGTNPYEFPLNEKLFDQDSMTGQGLGKSRRKRARQLPKSIPGILDSRLQSDFPLVKYKDGKLCINGQEPFNDREAREAWTYWKTLLVRSTAEEEKVFLYASPTKVEETLELRFNDYCESKKCSFDAKTSYFICGNPNEGAFPNGKHCFDGSEPPNKGPAEGACIPKHEHQNGVINADMGKWCVTRVCNLQLRGEIAHPVCGVTLPPRNSKCNNASISIQPILIFFLTLLGLSVFRNLP